MPASRAGAAAAVTVRGVIRQRLQDISAVMRDRACRPLVAAHLVAGLGDWAGRLAVTVVVYQRSNSAAWAGAVTVVSLLPWVGFGQLLATVADKLGRVQVMVAADLIRAVLFALMAFTTSTPLLLAAAFGAGLCVPPFVGARSAALVEITDERTYPHALALIGVAAQAEVLVGYAAGGALIAAAGPRAALAVTSCTFLISAVLLTGLRRTAAAQPRPAARVGWAGVIEGTQVWRADPISRRALTIFVGTTMFSILPEALVVPFADATGVPAGFVGVVAALVAAGSLIAIAVAPNSGSPEQILRRAAIHGAVAAAGAAALYMISGSVIVAAAAYMVSGAVDAIAVPTNQVVGPRIPADGRAAAMTFAVGLQNVTAAATIAAAGVAADIISARWVLAAAMAAALTLCVWAATVPIRQPATGTLPLEPA